MVPKPGHTTRPAALLTLTDRVIYEALVDALRERINTAMLGDKVVHWPRGLVSEKQWGLFESSCLEGDVSYVALADITAFYEAIDHEKLHEILTDLTGQRSIVDALVEFLDRVMRSRVGLPQGLAPSDALATAYLTPVDHAMARECLNYHRHGDDLRIGAKSFSDAKRALNHLERELRRYGLLLSGAKALIMHATSYRKALGEGDRATAEARRAVFDQRVEKLKKDPKAVAKLLRDTDNSELAFQVLYHENVSFDEMIEIVKDHLTASDIEVAKAMFKDAMAKRPGTRGALHADAFHHRITTSLIRLAAVKAPTAVSSMGKLISVAPEKTELAANYLMALPQARATRIISEVLPLFEEDTFRTAWEKAWLLRVVSQFAKGVDQKSHVVIRCIAEDEDEGPLARVEAVKALASMGVCDRLLVRRLWNTASVVFHPDLVAAAYRARESEPWCEAFLDGVKDEPVNIVVLKHLGDPKEREVVQEIAETQ